MDYLQQNKVESKPQSSLQYDQESAISYNKRQGYSKTEWKGIQRKLNDTTKSDLVVDGIPGKLTADSIYTFQKMDSMDLKDGKLGNKTYSALGVSNTKQQDVKKPSNNKTGDVRIPNGSTIMSKSYTPDLDLLYRHATQEGFNVKDVSTSANYVAKYCTGGSSQHQCTRGTSLYLQLASYARGEADKKYKSSCAANLFGSANALTNYNISSSVAAEFAIKSAENKTGKTNMNTYITNNIKKDGEFVTFKYSTSQHIVFHSGGKWYSDFKQGTPAGCGGESTLYSDVHFFNK